MRSRHPRRIQRIKHTEHNAYLCPTRHKRPILKADLKEQIALAEKRFGVRMYAYPCACGRYHLTKRPTHPFRSDQ